MKTENFNLYGIRFTVSGDTEKARELAYQARRMHFQLGLNGMPMMKLNYPDGSFVNVLRQAGMDFANIYVPSGEVIESAPIYRERKVFIPGICLCPSDSHGNGHWTDIVGFNDVPNVDIAICLPDSWNGKTTTVKECQQAVEPEAVWFAGVKQDIESLTEYGVSNVDDYYFIDKKADDTPEENDTGFSPVAYMGYSGYSGGDDYLSAIVLADGPVSYQGGVGTSSFQPILDDYHTFLDNIPDLDYCPSGVAGVANLGCVHPYTHNDGECLETAANGCCTTYKGADVIWPFYRGAAIGHLWFTTYLYIFRATVVQTDDRDIVYCHPDYISHTVETSSESQEYGGPQHRIVSSVINGTTYLESIELDDRAAGSVITFSPSKTQYNFDFSNNLYLEDMCQRRQEDIGNNDYVDINFGHTYGAYIKDIYANEIPSLQDKFFAIYEVDNIVSYGCVIDSSWNFEGSEPYYDSEGVYHQGKVDSLYSQWADSVETSSSIIKTLEVNLNGVLVTLDEVEYTPVDGSVYGFKATDSHIVYFDGIAYYMYAYFKYEIVDQKTNVLYVRYGYFKNDEESHIQSEIFYPEGITDNYDGVCPYHDVFGSKNGNNPMYGFGKCGGFVQTIYERIENV